MKGTKDYLKIFKRLFKKVLVRFSVIYERDKRLLKEIQKTRQESLGPFQCLLSNIQANFLCCIAGFYS